MQHKLKIGIAARSATDLTQIQNALGKMPNVGHTYVHYNLRNVVKESKNKTDLVIICDSLMKGTDFKYLRELSALTKIIMCIEKDVLKVAGGFKLFGSFHISESSFWLPIVLNNSIWGGVTQSPASAQFYDEHRGEFRSPSEEDLTNTNMNHLDAYATSKNIQDAASKCGISVTTLNSDLDTICKKLKLKSRKDLIPYLCNAHWCCIDGHFRWF